MFILSHSAGGQIPSSVDHIRQSQKLRLSSDAEWRGLLHLQKNWRGQDYSQVQGDKFFIAPHGFGSAEQELDATVSHFFDGPQKDRAQYQCAYLARRDFLVSHLTIDPKEIVPCPDFEQWVHKLRPDALTLVFASESLGNPASSFGHIFLKIRNPDNQRGEDLLNYGINYAARTENTTGALYALYGLFGYFPGTYGMAPYHHLIKEYTNLEGRDLWEYDLNLRPNEIEHLIKHLLELERGYFNYFFLDDNCAEMIAAALEIARPDLRNVHRLTHPLAPWVLPLDTVKEIVSAGIVTQVHYRPSLQTEFENSYAPLSAQQKKDLARLNSGERKGRAPQVQDFSTAELEAAQNFFALKGADDFYRYKDVNYQLSLERSKRNDSVASHSNALPIAPDLGADSSRVSLSEINQHHARYLGFGIRAVGNDLLGSEVGVAPFSEFELGDFSFVAAQPERSQLAEIKLYNILATHPVTYLETPLSWGFSLVRNPNWQLTGRLGFSFDFSKDSRWMNFVKATAQEVDPNHSLVAYGIDSLLPIHLSKLARFLVEEELVYDKNRWGQKLYAGFAYEWQRDYEFRLESADFFKVSMDVYF